MGACTVARTRHLHTSGARAGACKRREGVFDRMRWLKWRAGWVLCGVLRRVRAGAQGGGDSMAVVPWEVDLARRKSGGRGRGGDWSEIEHRRRWRTWRRICARRSREKREVALRQGVVVT